MTDKVQKIRELIEKRYEYWKEKEFNSHSIESEIRMSECKHLLLMLDFFQEEPVSDDLETELDKYIKDHFTIDKKQLDRFGLEEKDYMYSMDKSDMLALVEHFTNWKKTKEGSVSEDLSEAASVYQTFHRYATPFKTYIDGAQWQKEQMMAKATDIEVKVDAGGYPYIPQMELYDYDKDIPLAKEGDKYKVILIKED